MGNVVNTESTAFLVKTTAVGLSPTNRAMTTVRNDVAICEQCGLPAVCIDADLANPWYWCGQCCSVHNGNEAVVSHMKCEGIVLQQ